MLRDPKQKKNVNLPKLVRRVSLFSFTEYIEVWGYFPQRTACMHLELIGSVI